MGNRKTRKEEILKNKGVDMLERDIYNNLKELYNSGEKEKAFLTTVDKLREEKSPVERSSLASFASKMLFEAGKFEKALEYALEARNQARLADDYIAFCKAAISIGRIHFRQGRLREAEQAWHEALSLVVIFGNRKLHGRILLNLSILDQRRGNHVRALDILEKARLMLQEENDLVGLVACFGSLVISNMEMNRPENAILYSCFIKDIAERTSDLKLLAKAYFYTGSVDLFFNNRKKALDFFRNSQEAYRELNDRVNDIIVTCNIITTQLMLGKKKTADKLLKEAFMLSEGLNSKKIIGVLKLASAELAGFSGDDKGARKHYKEFLKTIEEPVKEDDIRSLHLSLRRMMKKKLIGRSYSPFLKEVRDIYERGVFVKESMEILKWLAEIKKPKRKKETKKSLKIVLQHPL